MHQTTPKEQMLKKIRKALIEKRENPYPRLEETEPIYPVKDELPELIFAEEFSKVSGQFIFCEDEQQFSFQFQQLIKEKKWKQLFAWEEEIQTILTSAKIPFENNEEHFLSNAEVGVSSCEALSARTGSILISNKSKSGRRLSIYPNVHIIIAKTSQLKNDISEALQFVKEKYQDKMPSMLSLTTGPSRTADIEKTLVMGAHGPKEIYLFLIDEITK